MENTWWTLVVCVFMISSLQSAKGLQFGFGQVDYTRSEPNGVMVEVIKRQSNVGAFVLTVTPLSYAQFDSMGIQLPQELPVDDRPDPAELELSGRQDFIADSVTVTFPASTFTGEETVNVFIPFIDDDTNEPLFEGFYAMVTIDTLLSDPTDVANAVAIRNGITLIRIEDDDTLFLTFEQNLYEVREGDGMVNNLVFVVKQDGRESEQVLPILAQLQLGSAMRGMDYQIPPTPLELVFQTTESRLPIPINVFEDAILEGPEDFNLFLTIPTNPVQGYTLGTIPSSTVVIRDNDSGLIGFEMTSYTVQEESGVAEICVAILEPVDVTNISPRAFVFFYVETLDGSAIGGVDYEPLVPGALGTDVVLDRNTPRMCLDIPLIDDSLVETSENLMARFNFDPALGAIVDGNFRFDPNVTEIVIQDTDVPAPSSTTPMSTPMISPTSSPMMGNGGDPHFSIRLPSGELLCYSLQGEHGFVFNLISSPKMQMNALFVPDAVRSEVTWFGSLGVIIKDSPFKKSNTTKLRFLAHEKEVYIGESIKLNAKSVEKLTFAKGKMTITEVKKGTEVSRPEIQVSLEDVGIDFSVRYTKNHLDMIWNGIGQQPKESHGIIGQFFRPGVEIDKSRRLLLLPDMEPVPVMRKPVWHFMERDEASDQLCWVAMNPGYQGKKLIQGHYLDYVVNDVLSEDFKFKM